MQIQINPNRTTNSDYELILNETNNGNCVAILSLSRKELQILQDALSYAEYEFDLGGEYASQDIKFLDQLHNRIKQCTGIEGTY